MKRQANRAGTWLLTAAVAALVAVLSRGAHLPPIKDNLVPILFFTFCILAAEALPTHVPQGGASVSVSGIIIYAVVLLYGPVVASLCSLASAITWDDLRRGSPWRAVLFNAVSMPCACLISGRVFSALGGTIGGATAGDVLPMLAGGMALVGTNMLLPALYIAILRRQPLSSVFSIQLRWIVPTYLGLMPLAYVVASLFRSAGYVGVAFFFLPLMVGRYSYCLYVDMRKLYLGTIRALAASLEAKDPYTSGHASRVAEWAVEIGRQMKLSQDRLDLLQYIGTLHDIGKIGIEDSVLNKPGKYTDEEMERMREHSAIGAGIVGGITKLSEGAGWIRHHHERYDGKGYPDGLQGDDIPLEARIIAAADSFDAMLSERPYKRPLTLQEARNELIRCSGTQFDPRVVGAFLQILKHYESAHELVDAEKAQLADGA